LSFLTKLWYIGDNNNLLKMIYPEEIFEQSEEVSLNTNEVMPDYQFYLKMYEAHQQMDFERPISD